MGYDGVRGTLILRDPYLKHPGEAIGAKWLETYRPVGPRGFVMVPQGVNGPAFLVTRIS